MIETFDLPNHWERETGGTDEMVYRGYQNQQISRTRYEEGESWEIGYRSGDNDEWVFRIFENKDDVDEAVEAIANASDDEGYEAAREALRERTQLAFDVLQYNGPIDEDDRLTRLVVTKRELRDAEWRDIADDLSDQINEEGLRSKPVGVTVSAHIRLKELGGGFEHFHSWSGPGEEPLPNEIISEMIEDLVDTWKKRRLTE